MGGYGMTREEEIRQNANVYTQTIFGELDDFTDIIDAYIDGTKWADEHPKKGLVSIDKVCAYLEMRLDEYIIRDLKRAMEG